MSGLVIIVTCRSLFCYVWSTLCFVKLHLHRYCHFLVMHFKKYAELIKKTLVFIIWVIQFFVI